MSNEPASANTGQLLAVIPLQAHNGYDSIMNKSTDLLIIGAGHLGSRVARLWVAESDDNFVLAETRSPERHASLVGPRTAVRTMSEQTPTPSPNVIFCVPPSAVEDYAWHADRAVSLWNKQGRLVMTSSTAVYAESAGGECTEDAPLSTAPRAQPLLAAEKRIRSAGGIVVRLAGLYDFARGPHRVYLRRGTSDLRPDGWVSLLHYTDAARLCLAVLNSGEPGAVYLGCDDTPLTRSQIADAAANSGLYPADNPGCTFAGSSGPLGRRCNNTVSRRLLSWQPIFASFVAWSVDPMVAQ